MSMIRSIVAGANPDDDIAGRLIGKPRLSTAWNVRLTSSTEILKLIGCEL
jgi:hypothetical protein